MDFRKIQKEVYQNKIDKGFGVDDVNKEFCLLYAEVSEAYEAFIKKKPDLGEELADATIFLLGIAEILGFDLQEEILKKVEKNKNRVYKEIDGVVVRISD